MLYRAEPTLSLLVQVQAPVIYLIQRMKILYYAMISLKKSVYLIAVIVQCRYLEYA